MDDNFIEQVKEELFEPNDFVERTIWRTSGAISADAIADFDSKKLYKVVEEEIEKLQELNHKISRDCIKYEAEVQEEEKKHRQRISELEGTRQVVMTRFEALAEKVNVVGAKVVHLGDQLEGVNAPRSRAVEAQRLMRHFAEFLEDRVQAIIWNSAPKLEEAADIIQKLNSISLDLPTGEAFDGAKKRISVMYTQIEKKLLNEFHLAHCRNYTLRMRNIARALLSFIDGYNQCVDLFIQEEQQSAITQDSLFEDVESLCDKSQVVVNEVFTNPEAVMSKFVVTMFSGIIKDSITERLDAVSNDPEKYLSLLHYLYSSVLTVGNHMMQKRIVGEYAFLDRLVSNIFRSYLNTYISVEIANLQALCDSGIQKLFESKGHKRQNLAGGLLDDVRLNIQSIQEKLVTAAIRKPGGGTREPMPEESGSVNEGNLLSQELVINLLTEMRSALRRCQKVSSQSALADNAMEIFNCLVKNVFSNYIEYCLCVGLQHIPSEPKSPPSMRFLETASHCTTSASMLERLMEDPLLPMLSGSSHIHQALPRKLALLSTMEKQLETGLERVVNSACVWIRKILKTEQRKSDFFPETELEDLTSKSVACTKTLSYLDYVVSEIRRLLDGKNVHNVVRDLGIKFHRIVYDHFLSFQYNLTGAFFAICDANEYRKAASNFEIPLVAELFDVLYSLCNLLVIKPNQLANVCSSGSLAKIDDSVLRGFLQLRVDYKTNKLVSQFRSG